MELFGIDSDRNCSVILYIFIVFPKEDGITLIISNRFHNNKNAIIIRNVI